MHKPAKLILSALIGFSPLAAWAQTGSLQQPPATQPSPQQSGQQRPGPSDARPAPNPEVQALKQERQEAMKRLQAAKASGNKEAIQKAQQELRQIEQRAQALRKQTAQNRPGQERRGNQERPRRPDQAPGQDGRPGEIAQDKRELRQDVREIKQDKAEIRQDKRELREDMKDLKEAKQSGDKEAIKDASQEVRQDRRELQGDQRELRQDRGELRQDRGELRQDRRERQDHMGARTGERQHQQRPHNQQRRGGR